MNCIKCGRELTDPPTRYGFKRLVNDDKICEICVMTSWVDGYEYDETGMRHKIKEIPEPPSGEFWVFIGFIIFMALLMSLW